MKIKGKVTRISKSKKGIQLDNKSKWYSSIKKINARINDLVELVYKEEIHNNISKLKLLEKGINMEEIKRLKKESKNGEKKET